MKHITFGKTNVLSSGAEVEGNRAGCVCSGTNAVKMSHYAGPAYCVGYCGNAGSVTRTANMNKAKTA